MTAHVENERKKLSFCDFFSPLNGINKKLWKKENRNGRGRRWGAIMQKIATSLSFSPSLSLALSFSRSLSHTHVRPSRLIQTVTIDLYNTRTLTQSLSLSHTHIHAHTQHLIHSFSLALNCSWPQSVSNNLSLNPLIVKKFNLLKAQSHHSKKIIMLTIILIYYVTHSWKEVTENRAYYQKLYGKL